jgi:hypothetical protein
MRRLKSRSFFETVRCRGNYLKSHPVAKRRQQDGAPTVLLLLAATAAYGRSRQATLVRNSSNVPFDIVVKSSGLWAILVSQRKRILPRKSESGAIRFVGNKPSQTANGKQDNERFQSENSVQQHWIVLKAARHTSILDCRMSRAADSETNSSDNRYDAAEKDNTENNDSYSSNLVTTTTMNSHWLSL